MALHQKVHIQRCIQKDSCSKINFLNISTKRMPQKAVLCVTLIYKQRYRNLEEN